jgi:hypothetical protein
MKIYLKIFFMAAPMFGFLMGLQEMVLQGVDLSHAVRGGLLMGLIFGLLMAAVLGTMQRLAVKKLGVAGTGGPRSAHELEVPISFSEAFARSRRALEAIGARIGTEDAALGVIEGRVKISWKSWGELVRIEIRRGAGTPSTRLTISSAPALETTVIDYGKGAENVERVARIVAG